MSDVSRDNLTTKVNASENLAADYETAATYEVTYDKKLAEKTKTVAAALRSRAAYLRARLDA